MSKGYTGCIDLERISNSLEKLSSIENCINNTDLIQYIEDIEKTINDTNFEHGNCIINYKDSIDSIYKTLETTKKEITNLKDSLNLTLEKFSNIEEIKDTDIKDLTNIYKDTSASQNINHLLNTNTNLKISNNILEFNNNIDDSIKNFMVKTNLSDYPANYKSEEEWQQDLFNKYENSNISQVEKEQLVEKDMSIWRQEQTGSKVTGLASSSIAEKQSNVSDLSTRYMNKYNMDKNDADTLANLKEELNFLKEHNGTSSEFNSVSNRLSIIENKYNINLRKNMASSVGDSGISSVYSNQSNSNITTIPYNGTEQTQNLESNTPYNTVPIGLGIAASGIAGAIGAVIIDDRKTKKKKRKPNKVYSDDGDIELEGEYRDNSLENASFASETRTTLQDLDIDYADNQRYRASSRDKDNLDKFYDETDDFFYKDDDE